GVAVVVVIKELQAPAAEQLRRWSNFAGLIGEDQLLVVMVETEELLIDVGDEKILPAVAVEVSSINAHAGSWPSRFSIRDTGCQSDLLKLSATFVEKEKVGHRVVGDEEIHQAVIIYIGGDRAE